MPDTPQQQAEQLKLQLRTHHVPTSALGQIITAMLRLGESVMVLRDTEGGWSLGTARLIAMERDTITMEFDRLRPLAISEVSLVRQHGAGVFEPPTLPEEIPSVE